MDRAHRKCYPHHKWPCISITAINSIISSSNNFMPEDCFKSGPCNSAIRNLSCQFCLFCPFGWITADSTTQHQLQLQPPPPTPRTTNQQHFATAKCNQQFNRRLLFISFIRCDAMRCVAIATLQYHNKRATKTKQINYTNRNKYTKHKNKQQQQQQIKRQVMFQQKKINQMHNNSNLNKKKWLSKGREKK